MGAAHRNGPAYQCAMVAREREGHHPTIRGSNEGMQMGDLENVEQMGDGPGLVSGVYGRELAALEMTWPGREVVAAKKVDSEDAIVTGIDRAAWADEI
jgi:hypothetical protein